VSIQLLAGDFYPQLLCIATLPIVGGYTVITNFFSGIGRTRLAVVQTASGAVALLILAPLFGLASGLGVPGLI